MSLQWYDEYAESFQKLMTLFNASTVSTLTEDDVDFPFIIMFLKSSLVVS